MWFHLFISNICTFKPKYFYVQLFKIMSILFYISYLMFQLSSCFNSSFVFDQNCHNYWPKFDDITYFFSSFIFLVFKVFLYANMFAIREICFLIKATLNKTIFFNSFRSILYDAKNLKQLKRVIALTFALVRYIYIAISMKT